MRRYRKRPKRFRFGTLVVLLLLVAVFLASCAAGATPLWVRGFLGTSVGTYESEAVLETLACDGEECRVLVPMVEVLANTRVELEPFAGNTSAVRLYRDELLSSLLREHYSLYTGNTELSARAEAIYPHRSLVTLIPKEDFESYAIRLFGGSRASHASTDLFEYLPRLDAYTTPAQLQAPRVSLSVESLEKTEHTYRMRFSLSDGKKRAAYTARFLLRRDGEPYLYSVAKN